MNDTAPPKTNGFNGIWEKVSGEICSRLCAALEHPLPQGQHSKPTVKFRAAIRSKERWLEFRDGPHMIRLWQICLPGPPTLIMVSVFKQESSERWTAILQITLTPSDSEYISMIWDTHFPSAHEPTLPNSFSSSGSKVTTENRPSRLPSVS